MPTFANRSNAPVAQVLSSLDSPYIIKYYDSFLEMGKLFIITEYAAAGNLHDYIKRQRTRLPEELIWKLLLQMLCGLNHMHKRKILHRDFKTLNVFLDEARRCVPSFLVHVPVHVFVHLSVQVLVHFHACCLDCLHAGGCVYPTLPFASSG